MKGSRTRGGRGSSQSATAPQPVVVRPARRSDAEAIARIYNEAIEERVATFETRPQSGSDFERTLARAAEYPVLVAEEGERVLGWAAVKPYSDFPPYRPVGECMLYVTRSGRRLGVGRRLLDALADHAEEAGFTKLVGKIFTDNRASIALVERCAFREVGVHLRHGRLDGDWRDVLLVERLLGPAAS